jgi:hypothetical protein
MKVRARELAIAKLEMKISDIEFQMDQKQRSTTRQMIVSILEC